MGTEFKELRKAGRNEITDRHAERMIKLSTEEGLNSMLSQYDKTYQGNAKEKFIKFLNGRTDKELEEFENKLKAVEEAEDFSTDLIITLEWKKSYMWGKNPRSYTNFGFMSRSIGGCGYCKTSTATAEALNSHLPLLKALYAKKDKFLAGSKVDDNHRNRDILGYGSGYSILPSFEGGVGVSSHQGIITRLGLEWQNVTSTTNTDVYIVSKK